MPSVHNVAIICFRCLNFVCWGIENHNDLLCDKCRKKEAERKAYNQLYKEVKAQ